MEDLDAIMKIYKYAQNFMIRSGNPNQWGYSYPDQEIIAADIQNGACNVICDAADIHGVFALYEGEDPTYLRMDGGTWLNEEPYVTIHRIAGDGQVHGLFRCAAEYCKSRFANIRIDTHADNIIMQNAIEKNGFAKCGIIYVRGGSPRWAYHWVK